MRKKEGKEFDVSDIEPKREDHKMKTEKKNRKEEKGKGG